MTQSLYLRLLKMKQTHRRWISLLLCVSVFLSLGVFALLHRTALAQVHTKLVLSCPYTEDGAERVSHVHGTPCYDEAGTLVCTLPEIEPHEHTDACYEEQQLLICESEESEGHVHTDACYTDTKTLACGTEESDGHVHTDACYVSERGDLICGSADEEHEHTDDCYAWNAVLACGLEEGDGSHRHSEACYAADRVLTCAQEEGDGAHRHTDACYTSEQVLVCDKEELPLHAHTEACFRAEVTESEELQEAKEENSEAEEDEKEEEPARPEKPESNSYADLETEAVWEKSFADVELSGNWAKDLLAIAATQIGYTESSENFDAILNAAGDGYICKGWTRYGAWYGYPYGDWCAMFVSFCLHYAGIEEESFPYDCGTVPWVNRLRELEYYENSYQFTPKPGDLIFFDWEGDGLADHVGLVYEVDEAENFLRTLEGNHTVTVGTFDYKLDDGQIMGYGVLPENPNAEEAGLPEDEEPEEREAAAEESEAFEPAEQAAEPEQPEEPVVPHPAQHFEQSAGGILVSVDADEGAFPEGTWMYVTPVNGNLIKSAVSDALDGEALEVQAVDIKFFDAAGRKLEPRIPVRVTITPAASRYADQSTRVVHIEPSGEASVLEKEDGADGSELVFNADSFSIYAVTFVVEDEPDETVAGSDEAAFPAAEETEQSGREPQRDAVSLKNMMQTAVSAASAVNTASPVLAGAAPASDEVKAAGLDDSEEEGELVVTKQWKNKDGQLLSEPGAESVSFDLYRFTQTENQPETNPVTVKLTYDGSTTTIGTLDVPAGGGILVTWTYSGDVDPAKYVYVNEEKANQYQGARYYTNGQNATLEINPVSENIEISVRSNVVRGSANAVPVYENGDTVYSKSQLVNSGLVLNAANSWTQSWTVTDDSQAENALAHTDENGNAYYYYVEETAVDGFDTSYIPDGLMPADRALQTGAITVVNTSKKQLADVIVTKSFSGVESLPETFRITATLKKITDYETNATEVVGTRVLKLSGEQGSGVLLPEPVSGAEPQYTWRIPNLETGVVVELAESGFEVAGTSMETTASSNDPTSFSSEGQTAVIRARTTADGQAPSQVDFRNVYTKTPGSISLKKVVDGDEPETDRDFAFRIILTPPEGMQDFPKTTYDAHHSGDPSVRLFSSNSTEGNGRFVDITLKHNETYTVYGLPAGTGYRITETADYSADRYSLIADGADRFENGTISGTIPGGLNGDVQITATNTRAPVPPTADLKIVKRNRDTANPLPGAQFTLHALSGTEPDLRYLADSEQTATTDTDGEATVTGLEDGFYELWETQAPDGYVLESNSKAYFKVSDGVLSMLTPEDGRPPEEWDDSAVTYGDLISFSPAQEPEPDGEEESGEGQSPVPATVTVQNIPGTPLPATGGIGSLPFTLLGGLLLLTGAAVLIHRRKTSSTR